LIPLLVINPNYLVFHTVHGMATLIVYCEFLNIISLSFNPLVALYLPVQAI
jgi:hypothetical protein